MTDHIVIKVVVKALIPFIQLFGLYVIAHGELGPGGGFQGGVILGASVILYVIAFGAEEGRRRFSEKLNDLLCSVGVLIYALIGLLCIFAGGAYLEYGVLPLGDPHMANSLGMYGIEIGVGITVAAVMIVIFFEAARHFDDD